MDKRTLSLCSSTGTGTADGFPVQYIHTGTGNKTTGPVV